MAASANPVEARPGQGRHLVLYDGVCGFCNRMNQFVLQHDDAGMFDFASLQSPTGHRILESFGKDADDLDTFYVVTDYRSASPSLLFKSSAAFFVLETMGGPWRILSPLGALPTPVLDLGYDFVARRRYRLFGRFETCPLPSLEHRRRFIDL